MDEDLERLLAQAISKVSALGESGIRFGAEIGRHPRHGEWGDGYTQSELDAAQARFDLVFPPDLVALLRERRPLQGYDWRTDDVAIREMLRRPFEGLLFDVEKNDLWKADWGQRPGDGAGRREALDAVVRAAPKLIPLLSHRYIPEEPHEAGNPVFSVMQSDIVYYGADLANYFEREFGDPSQALPPSIRYIRFWSDFAE